MKTLFLVNFDAQTGIGASFAEAIFSRKEDAENYIKKQNHRYPYWVQEIVLDEGKV